MDNNINILVLCDIDNVEKDINLLYFKLKILENKKPKPVGHIIIHKNDEKVQFFDLIVIAQCTSDQLRKYNLNKYLDKLNKGGYLYVIPYQQIPMSNYIDSFNGQIILTQEDNFTRSDGKQTYIRHPINTKPNEDLIKYFNFEQFLYSITDADNNKEFIKLLIKSNNLHYIFPYNILYKNQLINILIRTPRILAILFNLYRIIIDNTDLILLLSSHVLLLSSHEITQILWGFNSIIQSIPPEELKFIYYPDLIQTFKTTLKEVYDKYIEETNNKKIEDAIKFSQTNLTNHKEEVYYIYTAIVTIQEALRKPGLSFYKQGILDLALQKLQAKQHQLQSIQDQYQVDD